MTRRRLLFAVFVLLLIVLAYANRQYWDLGVLIEREQDLRSRVHAQPVAAYLAAFLLYAGVSLIPGITGKAVIYGWLFGVWWGTLLVNTGLTFAGAVVVSNKPVRLPRRDLGPPRVAT